MRRGSLSDKAEGGQRRSTRPPRAPSLRRYLDFENGLSGYNFAGMILDSDKLVVIELEVPSFAPALRCTVCLVLVAVRVFPGARSSSLVQPVRTRDVTAGSVGLDAFRCSQCVAIASDRSSCACNACVSQCVLSCHA